jgi:hypothetical protein
VLTLKIQNVATKHQFINNLKIIIMKLKIVFQFILVTFAVSLMSCTKDLVTSTKSVTETISNYYGLSDLAKNNGSITFNSNKSFAPNAKAVYQIASVLFDKDHNLIKQGDLKINDLIIKPTSQGTISTDIKLNNQVGGLYGKELTIQAFRDNTGLNSRGDVTLINSNLRLPSEVEIISPNATSSNQILRENELIKWVPDPNNPKKMLIAIEFDPTKDVNKAFSNSKAVSNYVEVDDNGSYQLKSSDFNGIPDNSAVTFYITRGNYVKATSASGPEQYAIIGYSAAQNQFKTQ